MRLFRLTRLALRAPRLRATGVSAGATKLHASKAVPAIGALSAKRTFATAGAASTAAAQAPVFSSFRVFKTKVAASFRPVPARLALSANGAYYNVARKGGLSIQFAEVKDAVGTPATGPNGQPFRTYNWQRRTDVFMLGLTEMGDLIAHFKATPAGTIPATPNAAAPLTFTHDPHAFSANAGQTKKTLSVVRGASADGRRGLWFLNFTYAGLDDPTNAASAKVNRKVSCALTDGEMTTLIILIKSIIPQVAVFPHVSEPIFGVGRGGADDAEGGAPPNVVDG